MLKENRSPPASVETRRTVFLRRLGLDAYIGAYAHEQGVLQPIVVDLSLDVAVPDNPVSERLDDIVCYDRLTGDIRRLLAEGHIRLVETLAERIAALALTHPMVGAVTVRVEKPNAIEAAEGAGVEIRRERAPR